MTEAHSVAICWAAAGHRSFAAPYDDKMRYAIVIEKSPANFAAYVPDLPGYVAAGATLDETEALIREAIAFHLEGLQTDGQPIPPPSFQVE